MDDKLLLGVDLGTSTNYVPKYDFRIKNSYVY